MGTPELNGEDAHGDIVGGRRHDPKQQDHGQGDGKIKLGAEPKRGQELEDENTAGRGAEGD